MKLSIGTKIVLFLLAFFFAFVGASNAQVFNSNQIGFTKEASDVFAQRRGTNPQMFRIYNTYSDASNYERFAINAYTGGDWTIGTEKLGTGVIRSINIRIDGSTRAQFNVNGLTMYSPLYFGGVSSSYPMLKNNGSVLNLRLGDDSGFASILSARSMAYGYRTASDQGFNFSSSTDPQISSDTGLYRYAAGVVCVGSGSNDCTGTIRVNNATVNGVLTVNSLTSSSTNLVLKAPSTGMLMLGANGSNDSWHITTAHDFVSSQAGAKIVVNGASVGNTSVQAASAINTNNTVTLPLLTSTLTGRVANVSLSGQTASISGTTLYTPVSAGMYRACYTLYTTTSGTAGTVALGFNWNNGTGVTNKTLPTASLTVVTASGQSDGCMTFHLASASNLQYYTTVSGATGGPQYGLDIIVENLQ